jgi:hypothetical protein
VRYRCYISLQFCLELWYVINYPLDGGNAVKELRDVKEYPEMCVLRFEERPKKFNEGSAVRLIDVLRKQHTEKPDRASEQNKSVAVE